MKKALYRYPEAYEDDLVEDYHGTPVADPFRWLEDPENPETKAWTKAQNALTEAFLAG
jgi:prolyl oligopeptidase